MASTQTMDIDENDIPPAEEEVLSKRLANTHINSDTDLNVHADDILNTSEESSDIPTPEGFFIEHSKDEEITHDHTIPQSSSRSSPQHHQLESPWPSTPPTKSTIINVQHPASCPTRPAELASLKQQNQRPLFISSSSGALCPPTVDNSSYEQIDSQFDYKESPATRAAAAARAYELSTQQQLLLQQQNQNQLTNTNLRHKRDLSCILETSNQRSSLLDGLEISNDDLKDLMLGEPQQHPQQHLQQTPKEYNTTLSGSHNVPTSNERAQPPRQTFKACPNPNKREDYIIPPLYRFTPNTLSGTILTFISKKCVPTQSQHTHGGSALAGFLALLLVTCANYMLGPMRDAAALAVGVSHIPALTLASTVLALGSSVPVGWLFEAPDPRRRRVWKRMGLTRGETQGTSLALFYRVFAFLLLSYALGFKIVDLYGSGNKRGGGEMEDGDEESAIALVTTFFMRIMISMRIPVTNILSSTRDNIMGMEKYSLSILNTLESYSEESIPALFLHACSCVVNKFGKVIYIMFFLVVHLMKLHSLSLIWGVTTEAMEYEETSERRRKENGSSGKSETLSPGRNSNSKPSKSSLRLKRLGFVGFGGTLGGIIGSVIASFAAHILHLSGLLIVAAILLEISANLSVELGRIMQRHWVEQMKYQSCGDLTSLASAESLAGQGGVTVDSSMRKSISLGSMKRVASGSLSSGNLLALQQQKDQQNLVDKGSNSADSSNDGGMKKAKSMISLSSDDKAKASSSSSKPVEQQIDENSFKQRLLRGITTILRSRLLIAIFTYNALYASTSVLLSFQRAELVANRSSSGSSAISNTAFLAKINTASSVAVFALQASGLGAYIATACGQRGALALMPIIRLCGVILLGWWHLMSNGKPPDLILFLVIDEFTKVINFAIAKPVRENLWRGLSAEARYEAKPIVDTLANRWGGGSAAFLVSFINRITDLTGLGEVNDNTGERSIFGFPPVLLLCMTISVWWTITAADVGNIRSKIDLELKKQQ